MQKKFKDDSTCIEDMMSECGVHDTRVDESMKLSWHSLQYFV